MVRLARTVALVLLAITPVASSTAQELTTRIQAIDKVFGAWTGSQTPGCAVGVSQRGKVVYTRGYGQANLEDRVSIGPDTIFESGSVAKQFTAAAIVLLVLDGKLSLDDPVRQYVPEVPAVGQGILIRHLLTHTSGLRSQWGLMTLAGRPPGQAVHTVPEILELVGFQQELNFPPGEEFLYNNTAFTIAGEIVTRVSGQPFAAFCRDRLFKPLGMDRTRWRDDYAAIVPGRAAGYRMAGPQAFRAYPSITNVIGNGGLLTTVGDLLRWNDNLDAPRVGGRAMVDLMETMGRLNDGTPTGYGLGLFLQSFHGTREVAHGGATAGYQTYLARFPEHALSVAVLCNTTGTDPSGYAHQVAGLFLPPAPPAAPAPKAVPVEPETLKRMAGRYRERTTDSLMTISWDKPGGQLRAGTSRLVPTAPGVLTVLAGTRSFVAGGERATAAWPSEADAVVLTEQQDGARPRTWHQEAPFAPDAARLAAYAGTYVSPELGVTYVVLVHEGRLVIRFRPAQRFDLAPVFTDGFEADGHTIRFTRNEAGAIDGFRVSAGRIRHVRFIRQ